MFDAATLAEFLQDDDRESLRTLGDRIGAEPDSPLSRALLATANRLLDEQARALMASPRRRWSHVGHIDFTIVTHARAALVRAGVGSKLVRPAGPFEAEIRRRVRGIRHALGRRARGDPRPVFDPALLARFLHRCPDERLRVLGDLIDEDPRDPYARSLLLEADRLFEIHFAEACDAATRPAAGRRHGPHIGGPLIELDMRNILRTGLPGHHAAATAAVDRIGAELAEWARP